MGSTSTDTLLKITATPAKSAALTTARDSAEEFQNYLRQATSIQTTPEKLAKDQAPKTTEAATTNNGQQQGTTSSPDDETGLGSMESEAIADEETDPTIVDEVLLSSAAIATVTTPVDIVTTIDVTTEDVAAESVTVIPQQATPPAEATNTATHWFDELAAATAEDPTLSVITDQAEVAAAFTTETMVAVAEGTAPPLVDATEQPRDEHPATQLGDSQVAAAESTSADNANGEVPDTMLIPEVDTQISQSTLEQTETITESDGKTSESNTKAPETPTPTTPANAHSQQTTQPTTGGHEASSASSAKHGSPLPTVDRARFVQRVANAFRSAQHNDGHIQLRLSPPELGSLRIEIAIRNGALSANLETETADARRVLLDNLPALRQRLAEQDIRIEKFEVDIRREGGQSDGQANPREQQAEQQSQRAAAQNRIRTSPTNGEIPAVRVARSSLPSSDAGLDVRI